MAVGMFCECKVDADAVIKKLQSGVLMKVEFSRRHRLKLYCLNTHVVIVQFPKPSALLSQLDEFLEKRVDAVLKGPELERLLIMVVDHPLNQRNIPQYR